MISAVGATDFTIFWVLIKNAEIADLIFSSLALLYLFISQILLSANQITKVWIMEIKIKGISQ